MLASVVWIFNTGVRMSPHDRIFFFEKVASLKSEKTLRSRGRLAPPATAPAIL